jgi:hypothetical protein
VYNKESRENVFIFSGSIPAARPSPVRHEIVGVYEQSDMSVTASTVVSNSLTMTRRRVLAQW